MVALGVDLGRRVPRGSIPRWAALYGYSEQMVKLFVKRGKAEGELPPMDDPVAFEDWAKRRLPKVTAKLKAGIARAAGGPAPEDGPEPITLPEVHESEIGLEWQLSGYQREFAMLSKLREEALRAGRFQLATSYFEQQGKVSVEIRQLERLLPTVLEQRGDYIRSAAVRQATVEHLTVLKRSLLGRAPRAGERLRAAGSDAEMQAAWRAEIDAVFRECCENGFGEIT